MGEFAGTLRERIVIERCDDLRGPTGVMQSDWKVFASCLAGVIPDGMGAESEAMALSVMPRFAITIRQRDGVAVGQRVRWSSRLLVIRQITVDPRLRDRMTLRCEEIRS